MLKLCLTVLLLGCVTQINCENLPVFIWGQKTPSFLPALSQLSGDEFVTLVKSQTDKETLTVVFVENSLSVEDLSQCKLKTETCFENLRKVDQKTYLTSVEDPVKALESSYSQQKQKSVSLSNDGDLSEKVDAAGSEKLLFVYLDDVDSKEDFAKHDELMSKLYNSIATKRGNVIAIYTARHPSFVYAKPLIRKVREAAEAETTEAAQHDAGAPVAEKLEENKPSEAKPVEAKPVAAKPQPKQGEIDPTRQKQHVIPNDHFLMALSALKIGAIDIDVNTITVTINDSVTGRPNQLDVDIKSGDHNIGIQFILSGGTWSAKDFKYGTTRYFTQSPVSAYDGKSFGCGFLRLANGRDLIEFHDVQIQPLFNPRAGERLEKFSDTANDCVGFFSPAIWGALFVVIILLSILTCGLTFIMDIRTMDRFDDPKGKTITINAQE